MDYYTLAFVFGGDGFLDHRIEGTEESVVADEEVGFAAEVLEHSCHFDGDVASSYKGDFFRALFELEKSVRRYAVFAAGNVFRNVGVTASGDENVLCTNSLFAAVVKNYLYLVL